ncbi:hypothetical protein N0V90_001671 [Kalmusia sp. IMI 367209]|nr:hypothetical protein N0V90_001671 [Kalmusia sp. IMI 367209]
MISPTLLAALAAVPAVLAQSTSTTTLTVISTATPPCSTSQEAYPLESGAEVSTWYNTITKRNTLRPSTYHSQNTVVITFDATTITNVVTDTATVTSTSTVIPLTVTVSPSAGWLPLRAVQAPSATAVPRIKRHQLAARSSLFDLFKRQDDSIWGYIASPNNGTAIPVQKKYDHAIYCTTEITVNETVNFFVTDPEITSVQQATASAVSTTTVSTTTTTISFAPTPTFWAACQANNVVNHIDYDLNGKPMYFDRIFFRRPSQNNTDINEIAVVTANAVDCCIKCQSAPEGCSEAFFAPGDSKCRMRLRQAITPISTGLPSGSPTGTATGAVATGGASVNNVCPLGSLTEYVGEIHGKESFPEVYALSFTNGPCGRLSVDTVPLDGADPFSPSGVDVSLTPNPTAVVKRGVVGLLSG